MFRLFHLQIIPSEERFTASQSTLPYSYKAFHFETLQTFAQNWAFISGTSEDQKRYSPCWLYAATDISFFFFFPSTCGRKTNCTLISTGPDASTVCH